MPHCTSLYTASSHRRASKEKLPPNVSLHAFGTYKFGLILLDDISVFPLVLLHSQLGVLHISVVCQVMYCRGNTQTSVEWPVYITRSVCPKADTHTHALTSGIRLKGLRLAIFCLTNWPNLTMSQFHTYFTQRSFVNVRKQQVMKTHFTSISKFFELTFFSKWSTKCNTMNIFEERLSQSFCGRGFLPYLRAELLGITTNTFNWLNNMSLKLIWIDYTYNQIFTTMTCCEDKNCSSP